MPTSGNTSVKYELPVKRRGQGTANYASLLGIEGSAHATATSSLASSTTADLSAAVTNVLDSTIHESLSSYLSQLMFGQAAPSSTTSASTEAALPSVAKAQLVSGDTSARGGLSTLGAALMAVTAQASTPTQSTKSGSTQTLVKAAPTIPIATTVASSAVTPANTGGSSGQGGYLLPSGYLSTAGSQIVDSAGKAVRIASVGWDGMLLGTSSPIGLNKMSIASAIASMKSEGFNTIRLPWTDAMLLRSTMPGTGQINYTLNPDLKGLTQLQILDKIIQAAGNAGMKIILDHHNNEATTGSVITNAGHQANGLWFDLGAGSDGTDGSGNTGTVTAAQFQTNWVSIASRYAGNSTVIGFDLDNEPGPTGSVNWAQGGPTDIWQMATNVGNAIQKVDPGALIIVEGPMTTSAGAGMPYAGPEGNLSGVAAKPVVLNTPNKVVYSVHEYPADITGAFVAPQQYITQMNQAWGYLVNQNIAPVWIGEMGSSMINGPQDTVWATVLLHYMNGDFAAAGGPSVGANQQPVSGDWWTWGYEAGVVGHTLNSDWSTADTAVQSVTNQMLYTKVL